MGDISWIRAAEWKVGFREKFASLGAAGSRTDIRACLAVGREMRGEKSIMLSPGGIIREGNKREREREEKDQQQRGNGSAEGENIYI